MFQAEGYTCIMFDFSMLASILYERRQDFKLFHVHVHVQNVLIQVAHVRIVRVSDQQENDLFLLIRIRMCWLFCCEYN